MTIKQINKNEYNEMHGDCYSDKDNELSSSNNMPRICCWCRKTIIPGDELNHIHTIPA